MNPHVLPYLVAPDSTTPWGRPMGRQATDLARHRAALTRRANRRRSR